MKMRYGISSTIPQEGSRGDSEMSDIPHLCFWLLFASVACAVCDTLCTEKDCVWLTAQELPNRQRLTAEQFLLDCDAVRDSFFSYPGDSEKLVDGLVLERINFETDPPHRLRVCSTCHTDLRKDKTPKAAKANGFWFGDLPEELQDANWVELLAASPVRMSGTVIALNEFKVRGVSGSAKTFMRGSFTFYMQNSYAIAQHLPACATDIAGSFACAVVGCKPTVQQLQRLFGARRSKVQALYDFMLDKDNLLAGVHELAREAHFSEDNLRTFDEDGGIPSAVLDALFPVTDKSNTIGKARSTHAHGNREPEIGAGSPTDKMGGHQSDAHEHDGDGRVPPPFIIETSAVMPTGEHMAKSADLKPSRLKTLQAKMKETAGGVAGSNGSAEGSLGQQANAEAAAAAGRAPPKLPDNALVFTHTGNMVSDFYDHRLFAGAYPNLFPHARGGHMDDRKRKVDIEEWGRICMLQRDPRFRESKTFLFCVCALIFRREAISNARWKLTGRVSRTTAETLASITPEDLAAAAKEMEEGSGAWSVLSDRPAVRALITSMQSVHAGASWTIYNKWYTRMIAISYIVQVGQPLWWLTFSPADTNSPIVLEVAGIKVDVTSRLKADFPDYAKRLQVVATNHVASAFFYHSVTEAVLKCLLRFGAKDGDGGVLGRVKGTMCSQEASFRCYMSTLSLSRDVESLRVISRTVLRAHAFPLRSFFSRA